MMNQKAKAQVFRQLHERSHAFVIPNPWDGGSARILEALGFEALATTSSGFANTLGRTDGQVTLAEKVEHCRSLVAASDLPVSADLENGFGPEPADAAGAIRAVAETGIVGGSIEDFSGDRYSPIYDFDHAVERVHAAVEAARELDFQFTLTARSENFLHGRPDLDDTLRRLQAFEEVGADVLYAPGLSTPEQVQALAEAVSRPINVLAPMVPGASLGQLEAAGARRLSVGGALARAAVGGWLQAALEMQEGLFDWTSELLAGAELDKLLERSPT